MAAVEHRVLNVNCFLVPGQVPEGHSQPSGSAGGDGLDEGETVKFRITSGAVPQRPVV